MAARLAVMDAVEKLDYRVTVGDISTQAGLDLNVAQKELMILATETGGHLQVAESGEIAYVFAKEFRNVLVARSLRLRLQAWLQTIWKWVFWAIRISFGIVLIAFIAIVILSIIAITLLLQSQRSSDNDDRRRDDRSYGGGGFGFSPWIWWGNPFSVFAPDYYDPRRGTDNLTTTQPVRELGFLESVFSFLFGDGNPNADLEDRRWRAIAAVIRNHNGVVIAEQITPYLDEIGTYQEGYEDYMIPVLIKFNGQPQVSEQGTLVYSFPELQKVATERKTIRVSDYLNEIRWQFSKATGGQIALSVGLGVVLLGLTLILGGMLASPEVIYADLSRVRGGAAAFIGLIFPIAKAGFGFFLGYAIAFLAIPAVRYFVLQLLNGKIDRRNQKRQVRSSLLKSLSPQLTEKLAFAQQVSTKQEIISADNLAYSTETNLADQEHD